LASASVDKTVILWNIRDIKEPKIIGQPLIGHTDMVITIAFSPDGKVIASGSSDNTIILWDVSNPYTPTRIGKALIGHNNRLTSIDFSRDGRLLASGSEDGTIILWDITKEAWRTKACRLAGRNLTPIEWEQYIPFTGIYKKTCQEFP
jgi:WD40 repeat protein